MWIPDKIYESLPTAYIAVGAVIVIIATYIGVTIHPMPLYVTIGAICVASGVVIHNLRQKYRQETRANARQETDPDSR